MDLLPFEDLLAPIPGESPSGEDLRFSPEWDDAESDRTGTSWTALKDRCCDLLAHRTKDLRIANFVTEACVHLHGFDGAAAGLRLARELLSRYWDSGLHPAPEDGTFEGRSNVLKWYDERFADLIADVPYLAREDGGPSYGLAQLRHARAIGWERATLDSSGFPVEGKRKPFEDAIAAGLVSLDMYSAAVKATRRKPFSGVHSAIQACSTEFASFSHELDERFGKAAPPVGTTLGTLEELQTEADGILEKKRLEEPDATVRTPGTEKPAAMPARAGLELPEFSNTSSYGSWTQAEALIRAGQFEDGLHLMTRLAATENAGRDRFHRKLLLADVCLKNGRARLARTILEELNELILKYHLDEWERPEVPGSVWSRLYSIYRKSEPETERTQDLYKRLSRLDPWQTFSITEE